MLYQNSPGVGHLQTVISQVHVRSRRQSEYCGEWRQNDSVTSPALPLANGAPGGQITLAAAGDNHTCLLEPFFAFRSDSPLYLQVVLALRHHHFHTGSCFISLLWASNYVA